MTDRYSKVEIDLTGEDMESLEHGSGVAFEFNRRDGETIAVFVSHADKDPDVNYILAKSRGEDPREGLLGRLREALP